MFPILPHLVSECLKDIQKDNEISLGLLLKKNI